MAIAKTDYLLLNKERSSFLLLRSQTHFHLIKISTSLSDPKILKLLKMYPCDTEQLRKLGLHFSAFKADNLRGVVIKGYQKNDDLDLWLGADVRKYQLGADYSDEELSAFFSGYLITRSLPPVLTGLSLSVIRKTTRWVNGISIACALAFLFITTPYKLWSILCILCALTSIILAAIFPASFTLEDKISIGKRKSKSLKGNLLPACIAPSIALALRTLTDFTFYDSTLLLICPIISLILCVLCFLLTKGLWNGLGNAIAVFFAVAVLSLGIIGQLNYLLDFSTPNTQTVQIIDKQQTRHVKWTNYDCTVLLPNGEAMELTLSGRIYRSIDVGDHIIVNHHNGCFNIPFSIIEQAPTNYR